MAFQFVYKSKPTRLNTRSLSPKTVVKPQLSSHSIIRLQRTLGKPGALSLLQSQESPMTCPCGGGCPRCGGNLLNQKDLEISQPGDSYEREADRVAEQAMLTPESEVQSEKGGKGSGTAHFTTRDRPIRNILSGSDHPLPENIRSFFGGCFGHDFGRVRVHHDACADAAARRISARAFAFGPDVIFRQGEYQPDTTAGRRLIAHELAHVVQQDGFRAASGGARNGAILQRQEDSVTSTDASSVEKPDSVDCRSETSGDEIVIIATGFEPYNDASTEISAIKSGVWVPHTEDFRATAIQSGLSRYGGDNPSAFFGPIENYPGCLKRVVLIAHGRPGHINPSHETGINTEFLKKWQESGLTNAGRHLVPGATIDIYTCDAGMDRGFLKELANYFDATVRAFDSQIDWCVRTDEEEKTIIERGKIALYGTERDPDCVEGWGSINSLIPKVEETPDKEGADQ